MIFRENTVKFRAVISMDVILNKAEEKLADPETRREYERRAKALSDKRSRLEDARDSGIEEGVMKVAKKLLEGGMPLNEVTKYTSYSVEELRRLLKENED
jgi:predicted transposase/invertase (TIGR01784 family)